MGLCRCVEEACQFRRRRAKTKVTTSQAREVLVLLSKWVRWVSVGAGLILFGVAGGVALAASSSQNIQVFFDNIQLVVNGATVSTGTAQPFLYQGHVYLPIRYVSEALNLPVSWDGSTATVYVGSGGAGQTTDLSDLTPYYTNCNSSPGTVQSGTTLTMGSQQYLNGLQLGCWSYATSVYDWNLNGQFSTLTAVLGLDDTNNADTATVTFSSGGNTIQSFTLNPGGLPQDISIPVSGVAQLSVAVENSNGFSAVDLANAVLTH